MKPAIIIPSFNGWHWLERCLDSLESVVPLGTTRIVVDDGSNDDTNQKLAQRYPDIEVIRLGQTLGFSRAVNLGILRARQLGADGYLILHNDTRMRPGWYDQFLDACQSHPEFEIVQSAETDFDGHPTKETLRRLERWRTNPNTDPKAAIIPVSRAHGACVWIRSSVIDAVGYLDPQLSRGDVGMEDLCRRARQRGLSVGWLTAARVEHFAGPSGEYALTRGNQSITHGTVRPRRMTGPQPVEGWLTPVTSEEHHYVRTITSLLEQQRSDDPDGACSLRASVVIPVRQRVDDLARCLDRVTEQRLCWGDFEILVCDDGSDVLASESIMGLCSNDGRIRYLRQPPTGPAAARNLGIRSARADIVVFTDSDTLPQPGWLEAILAPFENDEVIAVEGPVRTPGPANSPLEEAPRNEGGVHLTANMAYRRKTLEHVGGLDESFPSPAFEDVDLALAVTGLGKIVFAPGALVLHPWRRVSLKSSLKRLRQFDWLLVTAERYGCLGWMDRPTRHPKFRIIRAALVTLPLGRARKAFTFAGRNPKDALIRLGITFVEILATLGHVPRWMRSKAEPRHRAISLRYRLETVSLRAADRPRSAESNEAVRAPVEQGSPS